MLSNRHREAHALTLEQKFRKGFRSEAEVDPSDPVEGREPDDQSDQDFGFRDFHPSPAHFAE